MALYLCISRGGGLGVGGSKLFFTSATDWTVRLFVSLLPCLRMRRVERLIEQGSILKLWMCALGV